MRTVLDERPEFFYVLIGGKHGTTWRRGMQKDYGVRFNEQTPGFNPLEILAASCGQECHSIGSRQIHEAACPKCQASRWASNKKFEAHFGKPIHPVKNPGYASTYSLPTRTEVEAKHDPMTITKAEGNPSMKRTYTQRTIEGPLEPYITEVKSLLVDWRKEVDRAKPSLLWIIRENPGIRSGPLLRTKLGGKFLWKHGLDARLGARGADKLRVHATYSVRHIARVELVNDGYIRTVKKNGQGGDHYEHFLGEGVTGGTATVTPAPKAPSPAPQRTARPSGVDVLLADLRVLENEATEVLDKVLKAIDIVSNASEVLTELAEIERRREKLLARLPASMTAKA
jgi:hypothetical protein